MDKVRPQEGPNNLKNYTFGVPGCRSGGRARVTEKELKSARAGVSTFQSGRGSALEAAAAAGLAAAPAAAVAAMVVAARR